MASQANGPLSAVQQRGQTAVLGSGAPPTQLPAQTTSARFAVTNGIISGAGYGDGSSSSKLVEASRSQGVARRKLQRKDNARLASNPHVVRPSARDFALKHNDRAASFPIPSDLQHIFSATTAAMPVARKQTVDQSAYQGGMRMSYSDAHWFLTNRVGVQPKEPHDDTNEDLSSVQRFARKVEAEISSWLKQDVFLRPDQVGQRSLLDDGIDAADDDASSRVIEVSRTPHNLVWQIDDPFKRLTVHCLARIYGCATLSKDTRTHSTSGVIRQTWILKSRVQQLQDQQRNTRQRLVAGSASAARALDTPPTTDVGTDVSSEVASAINTDSDWTGAAMSDVDEAGDEGFLSDDGGRREDDVTPQQLPLPRRRFQDVFEVLGNEDDDVDHFADVES